MRLYVFETAWEGNEPLLTITDYSQTDDKEDGLARERYHPGYLLTIYV